MATNDKGSDLDVFEGLSKKGPGGSSSQPGLPAALPAPPAAPHAGVAPDVAGRTLLGLTPPPTSSPLPPPPGRTALAPMGAPMGDAVGPAAPPAGARPGVDVDWDDEDEATHIFDKADEPPRGSSAPIPAAGNPPPAAGVPAMKSTLLGLTPPSQSPFPATTGRFTPPPPPPGMPLARSSIPPAPGAGALPPPGGGTLPPPPPTLQGLGGSSPPPRSLPPPPVAVANPAFMALGAATTVPPAARTGISDQPPAIRPSTELTALLRPPQSRSAVWGIAGVVAAIVALAVWVLLPRTGRLVINVTDPRGSAVGRVDIFVDGRKQCDTAPCIVDQLSSGAHDVKVLADGYEPPPVQTINVESRRDNPATFTLGGSSKGTGIKVSGTQPGVKLYVDDREMGPLPQDLRELSPGDHVVKIVGSERYQPVEKRVVLGRDSIEDLGTVTLKVLKGKATISLGTPGARVFLVSGSDRRELPMLPISVDIDTTKMWALQASRPGYVDYNQAISFDDGQAEKTYVVTLEPRAGPPVSQNTWTPPPAPAPAGVPAPVTAVRAAPAPAPVAVPAAAPASIANAGGGGAEGYLNINSIPPSTCFVDGKQLGPTPKVHVPVSPGPHQVKFVNAEQQLTKTISVSVASGATQMAVAKLNN